MSSHAALDVDVVDVASIEGKQEKASKDKQGTMKKKERKYYI